MHGFAGLKAEEAANLVAKGADYAGMDHTGAFDDLSPARQYEIHMLNGILAGTGHKVVVTDPGNVGGAGRFESDKSSPDYGTAFVSGPAVEKYGTQGHEFSHVMDDLNQNLITNAYTGAMSGVKDPASTGPMVDFLSNYMKARRMNDPSAPNLSSQELLQEGAGGVNTGTYLTTRLRQSFTVARLGRRSSKKKSKTLFLSSEERTPTKG